MIPSASLARRVAPQSFGIPPSSSQPCQVDQSAHPRWTVDQEALLERVWAALHQDKQPELEELRDRLQLEKMRRGTSDPQGSAIRGVGASSSAHASAAIEGEGSESGRLEFADLREIFRHQEWDSRASAVDQLASWLKSSCRWRAVQLAASVLQVPSSHATRETLMPSTPVTQPQNPSSREDGESRTRTGIFRPAARHLTIEIEDPAPSAVRGAQQHPAGSGGLRHQEAREGPPAYPPSGSGIDAATEGPAFDPLRASQDPSLPSGAARAGGRPSENPASSRLRQADPQPKACGRSRLPSLEDLLQGLLEGAEGGGDGLRRVFKELGQLLHHRRCSEEDVIGALRCTRDHPELGRSVLKLMLAALPSDSPDILVGLWARAAMRLPHPQQRSLLSLLGQQLLATKPSAELVSQLARWAQQGPCSAELLQRLLRLGLWDQSWLEVASAEVRHEDAVPLMTSWMRAGMDPAVACELIGSSLAAGGSRRSVAQDWIGGLARLLLTLPPSAPQQTLLVRATELLLQSREQAVSWLGLWKGICQTPALWQSCVQALLTADVPDERLIQTLAASDHPFRLEIWRAALSAPAQRTEAERSSRILRGVVRALWPCSNRVTEEMRQTLKELFRTGLITSQDLVEWIDGLPGSEGVDLLLFAEGCLQPAWTEDQMLRLSPLVCHRMRLDLWEDLLERRALWHQWFLAQSPDWTYANVLPRWETEQIQTDCVSTPMLVGDLLHAFAQVDVSTLEVPVARGYWAAALAMRSASRGTSPSENAHALICILSLLQTVQRAQRVSSELPLADVWVDQIRRSRVPLEVLHLIEGLLEEQDWSTLDAKTFARLETLLAAQMDGIVEETMAEIEIEAESLSAEKLVHLMRDSGWVPFWRFVAMGGTAAIEGLRQSLGRTQRLEGSLGDAMRSMMVSGVVEQSFWEDPDALDRFQRGMTSLQILSDQFDHGFVFSPFLILILRKSVIWLEGLSKPERADALKQITRWAAKGSFVAHPFESPLLAVIDSFKGLLDHLKELPNDSYRAPLDQNLHRKTVTALLSATLCLCRKESESLEKRAAILLLQQCARGEFGAFYQHVQEFRFALVRLLWNANLNESSNLEECNGLELEQASNRDALFGDQVVFPIARLALLDSFIELDRQAPSDATKEAVKQMFQHAVVAEALHGYSPEHLWRSLGGSIDHRVVLVAQTLHGIINALDPSEQRVSLISILGDPLLADLPDDEAHLSKIARACVQEAPERVMLLSSHLLFWRASLNQMLNGSISFSDQKKALRLVERLFFFGGHRELASRIADFVSGNQLLNLRMLREWGAVRSSAVPAESISSNAAGSS